MEKVSLCMHFLTASSRPLCEVGFIIIIIIIRQEKQRLQNLRKFHIIISLVNRGTSVQSQDFPEAQPFLSSLVELLKHHTNLSVTNIPCTHRQVTSSF